MPVSIWLNSDSNLVGHWSASKISGQAAWPGEHTLTMFWAPKVHSQKSWHPCSKPKMELDCTSSKWQCNLVFLSAPTFFWPALCAKACLTIGGLVAMDIALMAQCSSTDGRAMASAAARWGHNSWCPQIWSTGGPCSCCYWGQWDSAQVGGDVTLWSCHHPQHQAPFPQKQPDLAQDSSWSNSRISLKGIYPTHRDINNLIHTEIHSHCEYALREIKREVQTSNYLKLSLALYFPN